MEIIKSSENNGVSAFSFSVFLLPNFSFLVALFRVVKLINQENCIIKILKMKYFPRSSILEQDGCVVFLGKGGMDFFVFVFLIVGRYVIVFVYIMWSFCL